MMKKYLCLLLLFILLLGMAACRTSQSANADESPGITTATPEMTDAPEIPPVDENAWMDAYFNVLQGAATFFSNDANSNLNLNQLSQAVSDDSSVTAKATKFAVVDLDNNGASEVILWLNVNNDDYYGFEVLHYQDGVVYGYTLWYRAFMELKSDGTFSFSSGAADNGFATVRFTESAYIIDEITYSRPDESNENQKIAYFVDNENATEDEFLSAVKKQSEKADAAWYDFTDDTIKTVLTH